MSDKVVKWNAPTGAIVNYPDSKRYKGGFGVRSSSSDKIYKISFDTAMMCWKCSCPGGIIHGDCKHLRACGLKGRKYGYQLKEGKKYGWLPYEKKK